uniref:C2H2-type domain-containing protein n=1 Tax=Acanthochromis polyacanthus TaxID=80966 RepID=A0A3Q1ED45_9TELE
MFKQGCAVDQWLALLPHSEKIRWFVSWRWALDLSAWSLIHTNAKSHRCQDFEKSFKQRDSLFIHRQQHTEEKPYLDFSEKPGTKTHLRSVTADSKMESELELRQDESEIKAFPLTVTPYDKSEFDQESLQPLCLYEIQTVADIDKDSSTVFALDHIKREAGPDSGADEQRLLSASPAQKETEDRQLKHINVTNVLPRRTAGKSTEFIIQFEAGTAQKPYKCPCCTKCFSLTKTLIRHIKIHTADKPYQCQFCGRNFCQKSDLVNHTRIHTGERPYQCQECNKSFTQKGNLVVHMRKHTGEKPYQCQECRCSFNQKSAYEWHMQKPNPFPLTTIQDAHKQDELVESHCNMKYLEYLEKRMN